MDVDQVLQKVNADLAVAERKLAASQAKVDQLREARRGLQFARDQYAGVATKAAQVTTADSATMAEGSGAVIVQPPTEWQLLSQQDAILRILTENRLPVETKAVTAKLTEVGRVAEHRNVKGALNAMKGRGKVVSVRPGLWALPGDQSTLNDFGPAILAGPKEASDDEIPHQGTVIAGAFGVAQPAR